MLKPRLSGDNVAQDEAERFIDNISFTPMMA